MDLHDFTDVAENYDYYLPSISTSNNDEFINFYLSLTKEYGDSGVLDVACGTGVLTVPIAKVGYDITALDISAPMIEVTKKKLKAENLQADLVVSNMTDFKLERKFSLAIIARSGFMHLLSTDEQRQALNNIRHHLTDKGVLTLNTFQPHPRIQAEQIKTAPDSYTLRAEYINKEGYTERIYNAITYNYLTQVMSGNWKFETLNDNQEIIDTRIRPLAMRQTYMQEMQYLFELCGFEVVDLYNDYRKSPTKGNCIWVVRKKI